MTTSNLIAPTKPWWLLGSLVIFLGVIGFITWSSNAPLSSAAISYGKLVAETQIKTLQHLEDGIIEQLLVNEGDQVKKGQLLFTLSDIQAQSELMRIKSRIASDLAKKSRLIAEQNSLETINFSPLVSRFPSSSLVERSKAAQTEAFIQRKETLNQKIEIQKQQIEQLISSTKGLREQLKTAKQSHQLVNEQIQMYNDLTDRGG